MTFRLSHFLGAIVLLTAGGVVHGMWTHRWAERMPGQGGEDLLARITDPVGEWKPGDFFEIKAINVPDKTQIVSRRFLHEKSNRSLVVSLSSGVPGVVAAHTPDVCYLGSGYKLKNTVTKDSVSLPGGGTAAFYVADFQKTTATVSETVRVRWCWSSDGPWEAPEYPRLYYARRQLQLPVLYKLYIVNVVDETDLTKTDPYRTFAGELAARLTGELAGK